MAFANYGQLKTFLGTFSNRTDMSSYVADFIAATEGLIAREVRAVEMVTTETINEADRASGAKYNLPSNYLGARALYGTNNGADYAVQLVSLAELRNYVSSCPPFFAATYGYTLEFRGTPETDASYDLIYFARPTAMSSDSDAPTLLTKYPDLYIHGGLYWLHMKAQDLELAQQHGQLFDAAAKSVNALATRQRGGGRTAATSNLGNFTRSTM